MKERNDWYFWPITFVVPILLVLALAIVLHFRVGNTENVIVFAASVFSGAFLMIVGIAIGSWIANQIQDRR